MFSIWFLLACRNSVNLYVGFISGDLIAFVLVLINFKLTGLDLQIGNHLTPNNYSLGLSFLFKVSLYLLVVCIDGIFWYDVECEHICLAPEYNGATSQFPLLNKDDIYHFLVDTLDQDEAVLSVLIY